MIKQNNNYAQLNSWCPTSYIYHLSCATLNISENVKTQPKERCQFDNRRDICKNFKHSPLIGQIEINWSSKIQEIELIKDFEDTHDFELLSSRLYLNPASVSFAWILTCKQFLKFTVLKGKIISRMQIKTREILVWKVGERFK